MDCLDEFHCDKGFIGSKEVMGSSAKFMGKMGSQDLRSFGTCTALVWNLITYDMVEEAAMASGTESEILMGKGQWPKKNFGRGQIS